MRTVLLTSDGLRHRYLARVLATHTELVGIVVETKAPAIASAAGMTPDDHEVMLRHLAERDRIEATMLGSGAALADDSVATLRIERGALNAPEVLAWVEERRPSLVLLFGTGVVRDPLLSAFTGKMINLHLGLSPYYRGAATNFWPLVFGEPECVGSTIHLVAARVDAGDILGQVRPTVAADDRAHQLGTKAFIAGVNALPALCQTYADGTLRPKPQDLSTGRVFRRRDFSAEAVRRLWRNLEQGMMSTYATNAAARCETYPIVEAG